MKKCEICGKESDIQCGNKFYCAVHYVENEDKECLFWHFYGLMLKTKLNKNEKNILSVIKKKYPNFIDRFEKERQKESQFYNDLKNDLIKIYEEYLKDPSDESLKRKAKMLHKKFLNFMPLLDKDMQYAINLLVDMGWDLPRPPKPSKESVKKLLKKLKGADSD